MPDCRLTYYRDIQSKSIEWLWYPYIPFGKITIVQGDPGEGKTTFILSLLSIMSTGGLLPCSKTRISGNAIYQNAEDNNEDTIKPRLEQHGADCSKICFIDKADGSVSLDDDLKKAVVSANAKILVLDPIQSFIGENTDMNRANVVRQKMTKLKEIAESTGCAVILIGHLNKNSGGKANYRGLGSIDFSAAARSVLAIGRPADDPDIRVMAQQKNNLGPIGKSLGFMLKGGKVSWIGQYDITADELLASSPVTRDAPIASAAYVFLSTFLKSGEKPFREIIEAAAAEGINESALRRMKTDMRISSVKKADGWYWRL